MIERILKRKIEAKIPTQKALIVLGPRQVGKTTLIKSILKGYDFLFLDGDDPTMRRLLTNPNTEQLKNIIGGHKFVFIDEAQRIENISAGRPIDLIPTISRLKKQKPVKSSETPITNNLITINQSGKY